MEEVSDRDLLWFFDQWIYEPGFPTFEVAHSWRPASGAAGGSLELTVRQVQSADWPAFRVPMEVELTIEGQAVRREIEVEGREATIVIDGLAAEPETVRIDPDGWVLKGGT
jgi:aminopeptidase N